MLLHDRQAATRLVIWLLPPRSSSIKWSAVSAIWPHQWHGGLSANSFLRFFKNSVVLRGRVGRGPGLCLLRLGIVGLLRASLGLTRRLRGLLACWLFTPASGSVLFVICC